MTCATATTLPDIEEKPLISMLALELAGVELRRASQGGEKGFAAEAHIVEEADAAAIVEDVQEKGWRQYNLGSSGNHQQILGQGERTPIKPRVTARANPVLPRSTDSFASVYSLGLACQRGLRGHSSC
ncbi:hypothetical protein MRB53_038893 [Persea americana]|nr:hypothetical protein MRB53_038893 [Persea americana]